MAGRVLKRIARENVNVSITLPFNREFAPRSATQSVEKSDRGIKEPLDDAAKGKHFSIMHHRYSQSSMLLEHTANSPILDWCCMLQQHATWHFKVSHLRSLVECWYCYNDVTLSRETVSLLIEEWIY